MFVFLSLHHPQSPHLPLAIPFQIVFSSLLLLAGRKVEEGGAEGRRRGRWKNGGQREGGEGGGRRGGRGREEREVEEQGAEGGKRKEER